MMKKIFFCCNQKKARIINSKKMPIPSSKAPTPTRQRKITVVSFAGNGQNDRGRSISTVRLEKVISEINDYHRRTELELKKSVKTQAKELAWFFSIFVIYVMFGAFLFFYIEECSDASMASDSSIPPLTNQTEVPKYKNISFTCEKIFESFCAFADGNNTVSANYWRSLAYERFYNECKRLVEEAPIPVVVKLAHERNCEVNALQLLKYAEFTIFTLLTIGYGNTTPITIAGRMTLMAYAVIGIPLAVTMYSVAGKLLVQFITLAVRIFQTRVLRLQSEVTHIQMKTLFASVCFMLTIMLIGCAVTTSEKMEDLEFSSSIYFWFVSLTTIGYGDIHFNRDKHLQSPHLLMVSAGNLLFGLGIVAAIIEAFSMALEKKDLQMSTIIIDNNNEDNEGDDGSGEQLVRDPTDQYREREYTELTDITITERKNERNPNGILRNSNGNVNMGHSNDDDHLYFDQSSISVISFENGHVTWDLTEPDIIP